jgi:hypothetical protein
MVLLPLPQLLRRPAPLPSALEHALAGEQQGEHCEERDRTDEREHDT